MQKGKTKIVRLTGVLAMLVCLIVAADRAAAQEPVEIVDAPPPVRTLSKSERAQLNAVPDGRRRTELALTLMSQRLAKAESFKVAEDYDRMFVELGGFHGLMDDTSAFIQRDNRHSGRARNYFKRYEMGLRAFVIRLELIRRDLPDQYAEYPKELLKSLRDARSRAIEPFFGDTVLPSRGI